MESFWSIKNTLAEDLKDQLNNSPNTEKIFNYFKEDKEASRYKRSQSILGKEIDFSHKKMSELDLSQEGSVLIASSQKIYKEHFDRLGRHFDDSKSAIDDLFAIQYLGKLADSLEDFDQTIIDAGCATGRDLVALANIFPDKQFVGYDISEKQIELANIRAKNSNLKNIEFHVCSHDDTPFQDGFADVLMIKGYVIPVALINDQNLASSLATIEVNKMNDEFMRILKDDGTHVKYFHINSRGPAGTTNLPFKHLGSYIMPTDREDPSKPFDIVMFYEK